MYHVFPITTPKNTTEDDPKETELVLEPGIIFVVRIRFPPGKAGKLHLQLLHMLHQLWPTNPDKDFYGDDEVIEWTDNYELFWPELTLTARTWNTSLLWDHEVLVSFNILPRAYCYPETIKKISGLEYI